MSIWREQILWETQGYSGVLEESPQSLGLLCQRGALFQVVVLRRTHWALSWCRIRFHIAQVFLQMPSICVCIYVVGGGVLEFGDILKA